MCVFCLSNAFVLSCGTNLCYTSGGVVKGAINVCVYRGARSFKRLRGGISGKMCVPWPAADSGPDWALYNRQEVAGSVQSSGRHATKCVNVNIENLIVVQSVNCNMFKHKHIYEANARTKF